MVDSDILRIDNLCKHYKFKGKNIVAVEDVSLTVNRKEFVLLEGPSGSGKTTVLLCAGALLHPDSGRIFFHGKDVYAATEEWRNQIRARQMGFVFQQFHLIPYLSVKENISISSMFEGKKGLEKRAIDLIEMFGLSERQHHYSDALSTGERQRVALARAFFNQPEIILADEPTGNLDDENAKIVLDYLKEYTIQGGTVLLVTHDARASAYADKKYRITNGKLK